MRSSAATPAQYVAELPEERRPVVKKLRQILKKNLPKGFKETIDSGILAYVVPHTIYPDGYHCNPKSPLPFISLASQKQYLSLYHMGLYDEGLSKWLKREWSKHTEAKLDMGRCCIRMRKLDRVPYDLIGTLASRMTPQDWIGIYERTRP